MEGKGKGKGNGRSSGINTLHHLDHSACSGKLSRIIMTERCTPYFDSIMYLHVASGIAHCPNLPEDTYKVPRVFQSFPDPVKTENRGKVD